MTAQKARKPLSFDVDRSPVTPTELRRKPAPVPVEALQQIGTRLPAATYRQFKAQATLKGLKVQQLLEQLITDYLAKQ